MKTFLLVIMLFLSFLVHEVQKAQAASSACSTATTSTDGTVMTQGQSLQNSSEINQTLVTGSSSGGSSGGYQTSIPRNFPTPMIQGGAPNYPYFGGPYRFGRQLLALQKLIRYKPRWTMGELERMASRPGKLNISESFFQDGPASPFVEFSFNEPTDGEDLRRFNRAYEMIGEIALDGTAGADCEKILGEAGLRSGKKGAYLIILIQQDGNFRMDSRSRYTTVGISPSGVTGGAGAAGGSAVIFAHTWGSAQVGYNTEPHATFNVYRATGAAYIPYRPTSPAAGQQQQPGQPTAGVQDTQGKNQLPYQKPTPSVLLQEKQQ